nr:hypothetical protein Iba_chr12dCG21140 [Ipomoea batatas]
MQEIERFGMENGFDEDEFYYQSDPLSAQPL